MRYLVLGCGLKSMGEAVAKRLLQENDSTVLVGDQLIENENATIEKFKRFPIGRGSKILRADPSRDYGFNVVQNKSRLSETFIDCNVVVNALPAYLGPLTVEAVLQANEKKLGALPRTHYCDLGGVLDIAKQILHPCVDERARACKISIVTSCGFQPGGGHIHAKNIVDKYFDYDRCGSGNFPVDSLIIYAGGFPDFHENPFYTQLFNLKGLEEIYYNWPLVLFRGKPRKIRPLSHYEVIPAKNLGFYFDEEHPVNFEAAVTSGLDALPYYFAGCVGTMQEKTLRYQGHFAMIKNIMKNAQRGKFIEILSSWLKECPLSKKDFSLLHIVAEGTHKYTDKKIKVERTLYIESDDDFNSMQKATGFTTAVIAKMIAENKAKTGAHPPEIALDTEDASERLSKEIPIIRERVTPLA